MATRPLPRYTAPVTLVESGLLLAQILERFETDRSWSEEMLARSLASPRAKVRELLETLHSYGWPFAVTDDGRWTLPTDWAPLGIRFPGDEIAEILRLFARSPRSHTKERALSRFAKVSRLSPWILPARQGGDLVFLEIFAAAAVQRQALDVLYYSRDRGDTEQLTLSVQKSGAPPSLAEVFVHGKKKRAWLLLDSVLDARASTEEYLDATGRGGRTPTLEVKIDVHLRDPRPRLLPRSLVAGLEADREGDGVRIRGVVQELMPLAQVLVGLGPGVTVRSAELRGLVEVLGRLALGGSSEA